jgi:DNA-binding IclR family transcriptional regulator
MKPARSAAPALERGLELLSLLARRGQTGATADELQRTLQIPRIAVYRSLKILIERNFVYQDPFTGRYRMGNRIVEMAYQTALASPLVAAARPILAEVARSTHQMSEFTTGAGPWRLMVVDTWQSERTPPRVISRPGNHFALNHTTTHGLCYLTFDGERRMSDFRAMVATAEGRALLELQQPPPASLYEECDQWRKMGCVWERRLARNNGRIAIPVYNPKLQARRLIGALSIVCDAGELTPPTLARWSQALKVQRRALEARIAQLPSLA